jgi:hypothetical protein
MTKVEDLVSRLRAMTVDWDGSGMRDEEEPRSIPNCGDLRDAASALSSLSLRVEELEAEVHNCRTWGIIEVAIRNPSVADYMSHWERRAEKAEAELTRLRTAAVDNDSVRGREGE